MNPHNQSSTTTQLLYPSKKNKTNFLTQASYLRFPYQTHNTLSTT